MNPSDHRSLKEHRCPAMPDNGVVIYHHRHPRIRKTSTWQLWILREATEQDLEANSVLNEVGETIWETIIEIAHCPYCGQCLPAEKRDLPPDFGKFVHMDHSRWHTCYG